MGPEPTFPEYRNHHNCVTTRLRPTGSCLFGYQMAAPAARYNHLLVPIHGRVLDLLALESRHGSPAKPGPLRSSHSARRYTLGRPWSVTPGFDDIGVSVEGRNGRRPPLPQW